MRVDGNTKRRWGPRSITAWQRKRLHFVFPTLPSKGIVPRSVPFSKMAVTVSASVTILRRRMNYLLCRLLVFKSTERIRPPRGAPRRFSFFPAGKKQMKMYTFRKRKKNEKIVKKNKKKCSKKFFLIDFK